MANTAVYKIANGKYSRLEGQVRVRYQVGDTFTPTDEEIKKLGTQIEPVVERSRTAPTPGKATPQAKHVGGGHYELPGGERVRGKKAATERLAELEDENE